MWVGAHDQVIAKERQDQRKCGDIQGTGNGHSSLDFFRPVLCMGRLCNQQTAEHAGLLSRSFVGASDDFKMQCIMQVSKTKGIKD